MLKAIQHNDLAQVRKLSTTTPLIVNGESKRLGCGGAFQDPTRPLMACVRYDNIEAIPHPFFRGLAYVAKARLLESRMCSLGCGLFGDRKRNRFFRARANASLETLHHYAQNGMINAVHMYKILNAEVKSITRGVSEENVTRTFREAIRSARRSGFRHDAALALERGYNYLKEKRPQEACEMIRDSVELYEKWGATAKVEALQQSYGSDAIRGDERNNIFEATSHTLANTTVVDRKSARPKLTKSLILSRKASALMDHSTSTQSFSTSNHTE